MQLHTHINITQTQIYCRKKHTYENTNTILLTHKHKETQPIRHAQKKKPTHEACFCNLPINIKKFTQTQTQIKQPTLHTHATSHTHKYITQTQTYCRRKHTYKNTNTFLLTHRHKETHNQSDI
ncbi:hypothetical protein V8G54_001077 [Vigna mungo]|uniref:Uncharacterized protein n=1 Tax=Vigna mungo TaxID=3915 RepID=A0AAQ3SAM8_VIGMU